MINFSPSASASIFLSTGSFLSLLGILGKFVALSPGGQGKQYMTFVHQRSVALPLPSCGNPRSSPDIAKCTFRTTVSLASVSDQLGILGKESRQSCMGGRPLSPQQVLGGFGKLGSGLQRVAYPSDSHIAEGQRLRHSHRPGHTSLAVLFQTV